MIPAKTVSPVKTVLTQGSTKTVTPAETMSSSETNTVSPTDAQLLTRFCESGDEASFRSLVERYSAMVSSVCSAVLRNATDVEDAFQATFFVLARKAAKITRRENIGAWLHRVALRCALTLRRRVVNRATVELPEDDQFADQELVKISTRAMISALHEQLDRLPQKCRVAMIAVYLEGLDQKSAAEKLGINQAAMQKRLERGRAMLRRRLGMLGFAGISLTCLCNKAMATSLGGVSNSVFSSTVSIAMQVRITWANGSVVIAGNKASLSLAQGVFKSMMFTSAIQSAAAIVVSASIGLAAFSAATLAQDQQPTEPSNSQAVTLPEGASTDRESGPPNPGVQVAQQQPSNAQPSGLPNSQDPVRSNFPLPTESPNSQMKGANNFPLQVANQPTANSQQNVDATLPTHSANSQGVPYPSSQQTAPDHRSSFADVYSQQLPSANQNRDSFRPSRQPTANIDFAVEAYPDRIYELEVSKQMLKQRVDELEQQLALYKRLQKLESEIEKLRAENAELREKLKGTDYTDSATFNGN